MLHVIRNFALAWFLIFMKLILSSNVGEACSASHNVGNVGEAIIHNLGEESTIVKRQHLIITFLALGMKETVKKSKMYFVLIILFPFHLVFKDVF